MFYRCKLHKALFSGSQFSFGFGITESKTIYAPFLPRLSWFMLWKEDLLRCPVALWTKVLASVLFDKKYNNDVPANPVVKANNTTFPSGCWMKVFASLANETPVLELWLWNLWTFKMVFTKNCLAGLGNIFLVCAPKQLTSALSVVFQGTTLPLRLLQWWEESPCSNWTLINSCTQAQKGSLLETIQMEGAKLILGMIPNDFNWVGNVMI